MSSNKSNLRFQRRLAAAVLGCGVNKVWMDPTDVADLALANSRQAIKKKIGDNLVCRRMDAVHSRARARRTAEAKAKGRHSGFGKRRGTREARMPTKVLWIRRMRVLRRMLRKYREGRKVDRHLYRALYLKVKGNVYRNKRVLLERIHTEKAERTREKQLASQFAARRDRMKAMRDRKAARRTERQGGAVV